VVAVSLKKTTFIKQFFNYAFGREMIATNPLKKLKLKKPRPSEPVAYTLHEVEAILGKAHERYRPIFELLAFTGLRIGEPAWLTWDDVDFEKGFVEIRAKDGWQPKDGDDRSIPMHPRVRRLLEGLPRDGCWVFVGPPCKDYPEGGSTSPSAGPSRPSRRPRRRPVWRRRRGSCTPSGISSRASARTTASRWRSS
jgi:integrase